MVDLGSGGGFPGLVLAIMLADRPQLQVTLVESDTRKAAFLRDVARQTGLAVDILSIRIENHETQSKLGRADVVSARALAPLERLLGLAAPLFSTETVGLFPKGQDAADEVADARRRWQFECLMVPSLTDARSSVVVVRRFEGKSGSSTEG